MNEKEILQLAIKEMHAGNLDGGNFSDNPVYPIRKGQLISFARALLAKQGETTFSKQDFMEQNQGWIPFLSREGQGIVDLVLDKVLEALASQKAQAVETEDVIWPESAPGSGLQRLQEERGRQ